jgi:hypothetical protein
MVKFFRKIRQKMLTENKFSKYLLYAIGEIVLVVIGILIALQINNANEVAKQNRLVKTYENSLISELEIDLQRIKNLDSIFNVSRKRQLEYLNYYRNQNKDITILNQKMDSIKNDGVNRFSSSAYTIDDLISTGNLSLLTKEKKEAILGVKNVLDFYNSTNGPEEQNLIFNTLEFQNAIDMTQFMGSTYRGINSKDDKLEDWRYSLNSEQYRLFGNKTLMLIRNYNFQIALF